MNPRRSFWLLALVHAAALLSAAKSFRDNPILGNAALNRGGLHVLRVRLDYAKTGSLRRQAQLGRLAALARPELGGTLQATSAADRRSPAGGRAAPIRLMAEAATNRFSLPSLRCGARLLRQLTDRATRRAFWRYWVTDVAVGAGSYALHHGLRRLPFAACSAFGGGLGLFVGRLRGAFRPDAPARATFVRLRPQSAAKGDLDRAMVRMCDNIGRVYAEYNILDLLWSAGRITVTGQEHLAALRDRNQPILVFGVHLGSWEVIGAALLGLGYDVYTLYRPARNRFQDRIVVAVRRRGGARLVPPGPQGARKAYRVLVERRGVFLTWADARRPGIAPVPAFGRPMQHQGNLSAVVRLARATGAHPIPAYVERRARARFHTTFGPPVELIRDGDDKADFLANMTRLDELISSIVVPRLDQWWMLPYLRFD